MVLQQNWKNKKTPLLSHIYIYFFFPSLCKNYFNYSVKGYIFDLEDKSLYFSVFVFLISCRCGIL